ncbi:MAG: methyltransferase domain-containing protein [Candidatus Latescibacteria bacterium]|nr:methyltransferase domain-containing protein [Candidatus Latescibacterota bacterium]
MDAERGGGVNPFDTIAPAYDDTFTHSRVGQYQRAVVAEIMARRFTPGMRVLEIGCGTGVDAVWLARRGVSVVAIDTAPAMVEVARRRVEAHGVQDRVDVRERSVQQLDQEAFDGLFDGVFSNFGVLNCVPDLRSTGTVLARLVKPGGFAVLCLMGPWCAWEIVAHLAQRHVRPAFRRLTRGGVEARVGTETVHVVYPSSHSVAAAFAPSFRLMGITGVGVFIPPSYLEPIVDRFPRVFQTCWTLERAVNRRYPFNRLGDHYCLELRRT